MWYRNSGGRDVDKRNEERRPARPLREFRAGSVREGFAKFLRLSVIAGLSILAPMAPAGSQSAYPPARSAVGADSDSSGIERLAHVTVILNKSRDLKIAVPFAVATVGAPDVADILPMGDRRLYVLGKKVGATNVLLYDQASHLVGVVDVEVKLDAAAIGEKVRAGSGGKNIRINDVNGTLVLSGEAGDAQTVDRAMIVASGIANKGVVNGLTVSSPQQVMLQVRFVEADRSAVRNLGVRWEAFWRGGKSVANVGTYQPSSNPNNVTASGNPIGDAVAGLTGTSPFATILTSIINSKAGSLDGVLSALEEQNVVRRLAEPNLVASSGESADFLAGGEFPVPVSSSGTGGFPTVSITYKEFGVKLRFTPTVLANGVISLRLEPEVSDIDTSLSVTTGGVSVPGLIKQRANTTVELRDGQSFAIAGMLQSKTQRQVEALPWLGTVPVLGALFSSKAFQQNETELVVIVSPRLIKPTPPGQKLKTPLDSSLAANDVDFFLNGKTEIPKSPPTYVNRNGQEQALAGGLAPGAPGNPPADVVHWPWESK